MRYCADALAGSTYRRDMVGAPALPEGMSPRGGSTRAEARRRRLDSDPAGARPLDAPRRANEATPPAAERAHG